MFGWVPKYASDYYEKILKLLAHKNNIAKNTVYRIVFDNYSYKILATRLFQSRLGFHCIMAQSGNTRGYKMGTTNIH